MNRRAIGMSSGAIVFSTVLGGCQGIVEGSDAVAPLEPTRPNVVLIFADDLGYADAGFQQQSQDVVTPNMDRLAEMTLTIGARCNLIILTDIN